MTIGGRNGRLSKPKIKRLYLIPILSKALDVLELLEQTNGPIALEDVYQQTNISKTSVYRILKTLVHRGYVAQGQSGQYRLVSRPRRLRFGFAAQSAEMPFSVAVGTSVTAAAAAAGVELLQLDNRYDPDVAIKNAEEFVRQRVDLVLEFQVEEHVAPHVAHIFKKAEIPLVAIDVPHPNATYFGVDNFEVGYEAGALLAHYATNKWKGKVDRVLGIGFSEAGSFVQSRIAGAFEGIRARLDISLRGISAPRRPWHAAAQLPCGLGVSARPTGRASASWWPRRPIRVRLVFSTRRASRDGSRTSPSPGRIASRKCWTKCERAPARSSVPSPTAPKHTGRA